MYKLAKVALLLVTLLKLSQEADTRHTIRNPCARASNNTSEEVYAPQRDQVVSLIERAGAASEFCENITATVSHIHRHHPQFIALLQSYPGTVTGLPVAVSGPNITEANIVSQFTADYRSISTYIMYLQNATSLAATDIHNWTTAMRHVTNAFFSWLCCVERILRKSNSSVTSFVNASVVTAEQPADNTELHVYLYLLMRNAQAFIRARRQVYDNYLNTL